MTARAVPAVEVTVGGTAPPAPVWVQAVLVAARYNAPTQCEVTLRADGDPGWPDPAALGGSLRVRVVGAPAELFEGELTCVELGRGPDGTAEVRLRGYDAAHRLRRRQTPRGFENVSAVELARTLAGDADLAVEGPAHPVLARVAQHRQSDFELLVDAAARSGYLLVCRGRTVRLSTLEGHGTPVPLRFGETLLSATVEANTDRAAARVTALGWDVDTARPLRAEARTARRAGPAVPTGGDVWLVECAGPAPDELAGTAQLALDTRAARAFVLRGTACGDARLHPGTPIAVSGFTALADGVHVLAEVAHRLDAGGYRTTFSTQPPAPPTPDRGSVVTLGRVTAVDDPAGRGRVRVCLPTLGDADAGWLGVLCPGAGRGRGLLALPDVGDTVAVALPHADPAAGLVLGSLYGALVPPDAGVDGDAVRRWSLRTADGQSIVLDDAAHSVRIADRDGSHLELSPDGVRLRAAADLLIDAAGRAVTIRARSVDFTHA